MIQRVHDIDTTSTRHRNWGRRSAANRMGHSDPGRGFAASRAGRVKAVEADKGRLMG